MSCACRTSASRASLVRARPAQLNEATFAKQVAEQLNEDALNNRYAHLVLVADPTTLGRIRPLLHKEVQARLLGDIAKDLTNAPLADIQKALAA